MNSNYNINITPHRYVYHISYRGKRESILKQGLLGNTSETIGYENAVFAHNSDFINLDWYPLVMDNYEWRHWDDYDWKEVIPIRRDVLIDAVKDYYDIWRIDTYKLGRDWYVDQVGLKEFGGKTYKSGQSLYVVCFGNIPREYITLCQIDGLKRKKTKTSFGRLNILIPRIVEHKTYLSDAA